MPLTPRRARRPDPIPAELVSSGFSHSDPFQILSAEHALLRRDLARLRGGSMEGQTSGTANELLASFSGRLRMHLAGEERVLYPVCERLFGGKDGPAPVLREDHRLIRERIGLLVDEVGQGGLVSRDRLDTLDLEIQRHFGKEEQVLFPLTRALLTGTESGTLARKLRAPPVR